jgi:hypothetical protein
MPDCPAFILFPMKTHYHLPGGLVSSMQRSAHVPTSLFLIVFVLLLLVPFPGSTAPSVETPEAPAFSIPSGFYAPGQPLEISHPDAETSIYYTLDGSLPTTSSYLYSGPILLEAPAHTPESISLIRTNPIEADPLGFGWETPSAFQDRAMVIRAMAYRQGSDPSPVAEASYFAGIEVPTLPVISIIMDPHHLFDHHDGIYVPGIVYEEFGFGDGWYGQPNANYYRRGDEWEVPSRFEFFEAGTPVVSQTVGIRIHGGGTRALPMKSLRIYARSEYGNSTINHQVFPWQHHQHYKRLILRNSGQDFFGPGTLLRDGMLQKLAAPLDVAIQDYRPAIVFINGEYWGIHNIRERYDKHYFERKYRIPENELDLLENNQEVVEGSVTHYQQMLEFIEGQDLSDPGAFALLETMMDTENFMDYYITNIFVNNTDWPGHNLKYWRKRVQYQPHAPWGQDGRWRWALNDLDFAFAWAGGLNSSNFNTLAYATDPEGGSWPPNPPWSTFLIRKLLENQSFRDQFINRFADLLNTVFSTPHLLANINHYSNLIQPAINNHLLRWAFPAEDMNQWLTNVNRMKTFATQRPARQTEHIREHFGLTGSFQFTADILEPGSGSVNVNRLHITPDNPLLEHTGHSLPWTGQYFKAVPFPLTAIPAEGYRFDRWIDHTGEEWFDNPLTVNATEDLVLTAVFVEDDTPPEELVVLHYWHFNGLPSGALGQVAADQSFSQNAVISYPGTGTGYIDRVDDGTLLNALDDVAEGYALRVRNPSDTRHLEMQLPTPGYENIRLSYAVKRTSNGAQEQNVYYRINDAGQWMMFGDFITISEAYELVTIDFSSLEEAANNPSFAVRIAFGGDNASGDSGNNRFDNIRLEGTPMEDTNIPPYVVTPIPLQQVAEGWEPLTIDLTQVFTDDDGDPLTFAAISSRPDEVGLNVDGDILSITPVRRGDAEITVTASDGHNAPVPTLFRVLVYPEAYSFNEPAFLFDSWDAEQPERNYPGHIIFLQSDINDPGLDYPLLYPYHIDHDDYHADDQATIGFPYNNTGRTRINGLGDEGIGFINTGRGRDLGGLLLAIDPSQAPGSHISFVASTLLPNSRVYNLRLQYRAGLEGPFHDLTDAHGNIVEYQRNENPGHGTYFHSIPLPGEVKQEPYLQLLWRYYFTGEQIDPNSGQRAQLRLDNIRVGQPATSAAIPLAEELNLELFPNPATNQITARINGLQPGAFTWQIAGMQGSILLESTVDHAGPWQHAIDVAHLPAGVYIFRVITRQGIASKRFVKN